MVHPPENKSMKINIHPETPSHVRLTSFKTAHWKERLDLD